MHAFVCEDSAENRPAPAGSVKFQRHIRLLWQMAVIVATLVWAAPAISQSIVRTFTLPTSVSSITADRANRMLYVAEEGSRLFSINSTGGVTTVTTNFATGPGGFFPYVATDIEYAGGYSYFVDNVGNLLRTDVGTGTTTLLTTFSGFQIETGVAIVGNFLYATPGYTSSSHSLMRYDLSTGAIATVTASLPANASSLEYNPADGLLYFAVYQGGYFSISPAGGAIKAVSGTVLNYGNFTIDPTGAFIYGQSGSTIVKIQISNGSATSVMAVPFSNFPDLIFAPASANPSATSLYVTEYSAVYEINIASAPAIGSISSSSGVSLGGQSVTINGTNLSGATVSIGGTSATVTNSNATSVTFNTPAHPAGGVNVTVTTTGGTATSVGGYTYTLAPSSTTVSSSASPSAYGASVTFTATVTSGASGTVTFVDGSTTLGLASISGGTATYSTSALNAGSHSITAVYGGDTNYATSTSAAITQNVNQGSTTTSVATSGSPSTYGASVTFTAIVTSGAAGTVTFKDGSTTLGTGTSSSGTATYSTSALTAGSHSITAVYGGDTNYATSTSAAITQNVNQALMTISVATSGSPSVFNAAVTFTATVTSGATGSVTFQDGGLTLLHGTRQISGNTATYTTSGLGVGSHSITAFYDGDTNYALAGSAAITQTVVQASSSTSVATSGTPSTYGTLVTFTATVDSGAIGTVTFKDGPTTLGTGSISGGTATYSTSALSAGSHSITAVYGGDTNYASSTSAAITQSVNQASTTTSLATSGTPSTFGKSVTFTATVTSGATGTVTFKDGAATLGTGTLSGGVAVFTTASARFSSSADQPFSTGSHSITAIYGGDTNFFGSTSDPVPQQVNQAGTRVVNLVSDTPSQTYGTAVTFVANVRGDSREGSAADRFASGSVTFFDGANALGSAPISNGRPGTVSFTTSALSVGSHTITAVYSGDSNYLGSTSDTAEQQVTQASSSISIVSSGSPSTYGVAVIFTATVTGGATGAVTFKDGSTTLGSGTISSGTATFSTSALNAGSHSITAVYGGDTNYATSTSAAITQNVNQASTTTSVVTSGSPSTYGNSVTFTATVTGGATGAVTFKDGSTTLGSGTISSGTATFSTSALNAGSHSITVVYGGDTNYATSTSASITQNVNQASTTTSVVTSGSPSTYGTSVTFTATATTGATGTVTFKDGSTTLGTGAISSGTATYSTSALNAGSHSITAVYGGDTNYATSTSPAITQNVNQASTTTSVATSGSPSTYGGSVTFTATVTSGATGTVTFKDGSTTLGTGTLSAGSAMYATSALNAGSHSITAVYGGDANYATSTSAAITQNVNQASTTTSVVTSGSPSTYGTSVTFTATVTNGATGSVTFKDGSTTLGTGTISSGTATYSTSALNAASHSITAVFGGDTNYAASTSAAITQNVNQASTTTSVVTSGSPSTYGTSVTFTATVTTGATGTVTFKDGSTTLGTGAIRGGTATYSTSALNAGSHSITAVYGGDANYAASTSPAISQTVNLAPTTIALLSSLNPATYGASVTFTATVTTGAPGTVTFRDGTTSIGTAPLSGGTATLTTNTLAVGLHSMTAAYSGDSNYALATSSALTQDIENSTGISSIAPNSAPVGGGFTIAINGFGFESGAMVMFGSVPADSVNVVSGATISVKTPVHAAGPVDVTITNPDATHFTLANGFTFTNQNFDSNGDGTTDPSDIFYLVTYLFLSGPRPVNGMASGDANGDGVVDPADIFYLVNYLFAGGPAPHSMPDPGRDSASSLTLRPVLPAESQRLAGAVTLGTPSRQYGRWLVPVIVSLDANSTIMPQAWSLQVRASGTAAITSMTLRRAGAAESLQPVFETARQSEQTASYLVTFDRTAAAILFAGTRSVIVAELEVTASLGKVDLRFDPALTLLSDGGLAKATAESGTLSLIGVTADDDGTRPARRRAVHN